MAYTKNNWKNSSEAGAIPINATNLNHMEDGIYGAHEGLVGTAKPTIISATLSVSGWSGNDYTINNEAIGANDIIEISPITNILSFALGIIGLKTQSAGSLTITSFGTKPTVNINVQLVLWKVVT